jgi:hypothetical protein
MMKKIIFTSLFLIITTLLNAQSFSLPMEGDGFKGILTYNVIDQIEYASIVNKNNLNESNAIFDITQLFDEPFYGMKTSKGKIPSFNDIYYLKASYVPMDKTEYSKMYSEMELVIIGNAEKKRVMQIMYFPPWNFVGLSLGDSVTNDIYKEEYTRGLLWVKDIE